MGPDVNHDGYGEDGTDQPNPNSIAQVKEHQGNMLWHVARRSGFLAFAIAAGPVA